MMHSSTTDGSTPARRTASATTSAPSCGAVKPFSAPRNRPVAVRTALTMTASCRSDTDGQLRDHFGSEERLQSVEDDAGGARNLFRPGSRFGFDEEIAAFQTNKRAAIHRGSDGDFPRKLHFARRH